MSEELEKIKTDISTKLDTLLSKKNKNEKCGLRRDKFCLADYLCQVITIVFDKERNFNDDQKKELTKYFFSKKENVALTNRIINRNNNLIEIYESIVDETLSFFRDMIIEEEKTSKFIKSLETLNCPQFTENINAYLSVVQVEDIVLEPEPEPEVKKPEPEVKKPEPEVKTPEEIDNDSDSDEEKEFIKNTRDEIKKRSRNADELTKQLEIIKANLHKMKAQLRIKRLFLKFGLNMDIVKDIINEYNNIWTTGQSIFTDKKNNVFQDDIRITTALEKEFKNKVQTDIDTDESSITAVSNDDKDTDRLIMYKGNTTLDLAPPVVTVKKVFTYMKKLLKKINFKTKVSVIKHITDKQNKVDSFTKFYPSKSMNILGYKGNKNFYKITMPINLEQPQNKKTKGGKTKRKTKLRTRNKKLRSNKKRRHGKKTYKKRKTARRK